MRGVYLVAAELARHGFIASPTSRSAQAADILATDSRCKRAWSIQVKTKVTKATYWLVTKHAKKTVARSHFYVLVNIRDEDPREFFVIPSKKVAGMVYTYRSKNAVWFSIGREDAKPFLDKWKLLRDGKH
jgi:hypothetical protein